MLHVLAAFLLLLCSSCATRLTPQSERKTSVSHAVFGFYNEVISPADGDRCLMLPSCSAYTREAVEKHGWFAGWIMGCDRLIRCGGDEFDVSGLFFQDEERYCKDPVDSNDFWWSKP